jgi:2',3'-cyclic-nucleotide 2'-phosphodiesterase (5'-nucleotidase family)
VVGNPSHPLLGERPWSDVANLPIAAAAAGNHEFDDGVDALLEAARGLSFPLLCANVDVGLAPSAVLETAAGGIGVIGLTSPNSHRYSRAPAPAADWPHRVGELARELRRGGARWVVALLHDGVEWWPADPIATRAARLEDVARPWADAVDLILGGHNFAAWTGALAGTPAGEPHVFAASLVVVDLADRPVVRGVYRVPARPAKGSSPAVEAIERARSRVVGETPHHWLTRTGAMHHLPELLADALRSATGADAGLAVPSFHGTPAPLDGAIASLGPGPISELDVARLFGSPDYDPVIAELRPGELHAAMQAHWATADPANRDGDRVWWNWCRMPAAAGIGAENPTSVAMIPGVAEHLSLLLGRDIQAGPAGTSARDALIAAVS